MTDLTPAETLTAAAKRLREAATEATPGPWFNHDTHLSQGGHTATVLTSREDMNEIGLVAWLPTWSHEPWNTKHNAWANSAYVAQVHPGVGLALADWLDEAARRQRATEAAAARTWANSDDVEARDRWIAAQTEHQALAVARQLLSEVTE
jgi:hypothetical protein